MGCLNVTISAIGESLKPRLTSVTDGIKATLSGFEVLRVALQLTPPMEVSLTGIGEALKVSFSEICTTPQDFYLEVSPKVMWLTPDNNFTDNTAILDWQPCKRLSDGMEGFWDCVTQTFIEPM